MSLIVLMERLSFSLGVHSLATQYQLSTGMNGRAKMSEQIFGELVNGIFGFSTKSLNYQNPNNPVFDLIDKEASIGFQVSAISDNYYEKIRDTFRKYENLNEEDKPEKVIFVFVVEPRPPLNRGRLEDLAVFGFNLDQHVITPKSVMRQAQTMNYEKLEPIVFRFEQGAHLTVVPQEPLVQANEIVLCIRRGCVPGDYDVLDPWSAHRRASVLIERYESTAEPLIANDHVKTSKDFIQYAYLANEKIRIFALSRDNKGNYWPNAWADADDAWRKLNGKFEALRLLIGKNSR